MKILILFTLIVSSALANTQWTHQVSEGQDGGIAADYYFYKAFSPKSESSVMSILKARVVYAYGYHPESESIIVADYDFHNGLRINISRADKADIIALISGKDVKMKSIRDYTVPYEMVRGQMLRPTKETKLTDAQQGDIFNLVHVLCMQRGSIQTKANK